MFKLSDSEIISSWIFSPFLIPIILILPSGLIALSKSFTLKDQKKNYDDHLRLLSETKLSTDKFFENVKVNDENQDIKNNRLELLQILCTTFNSFIDFSKLEGT